jgi:hypothetical protein
MTACPRAPTGEARANPMDPALLVTLGSGERDGRFNASAVNQAGLVGSPDVTV